MPIRRNIFEIDQPVHIVSRAVDGKNIFKEEDDCFRFIFQLYVANIGKPNRNLRRQDIIKVARALLCGEEVSFKFADSEHSPLVYFLDFSLVVNHNHLYLAPRFKNSIPFLIRNLNSGFAQYFNLKHGRKGVLFDGPYRAVITKTQFQADATSRYINTINPLDVFQPGWREEGLKNPEEAFKFLKTYPFSSFQDKIGKRKSKILAPSEILEKYLALSGNVKTYQEFSENFLRDKSTLSHNFFLE